MIVTINLLCCFSLVKLNAHICHRIWEPVTSGHGRGQQICEEADILLRAGAEVGNQWTAKHCILCQWRWIHWRVAQEQKAWWGTFVSDIPSALKNSFQLENFDTACLCCKGGAHRFGRSLAPSIMASGKKGNPTVTVPTLCWCQKQRRTPGNTVASGKWAKNTYVF